MDFLGVGLPELLVILVLTLIVVGPRRLPEMAAQLARFMRAFRRYTAGVTREFNETMGELEREYDEMKGEWKEVGQGLDETARSVGKELESADRDARKALKEAKAATEEPSKPVSPPG
jgi:Tat protein translocase TatB subunit